MACTTILVGRKASYDGSTMIARNDDSGSGHFTPKKFVVVPPQEHPAVYRSVLSHVEVELPDSPMRMTAMPNAVEGKGIWAAGGVNEAGVGMTATETITSALARRTLFIWYCLTSTLRARACCGWASCWKNTALTR